MDLTDNEIAKLENFPLMKRLHTLLAANNRVSRIADGLGAALPQLKNLVLSNNRIASLGEIESLGSLSALTSLSLLGNPVTRKQHYRYYVIYKNPGLHVLDFQRVRRKERIAAAKLFASKAGRVFAEEVTRTRYQTSAQLAADASVAAANGDAASSSSSAAGGAPAFSPAQLALIQQAIAAASSREEIETIEGYLRKGQLPPGLGAESNSAAASDGSAPAEVTASGSADSSDASAASTSSQVANSAVEAVESPAAASSADVDAHGSSAATALTATEPAAGGNDEDGTDTA